MRTYSKIPPSIWMGSIGDSLRRSGQDAHFLAHYLMTCPHANSIGLYPLPIPYVCHDMNMNDKRLREAIKRLAEIGFCMFEDSTSTIYIPSFAESQYGQNLKPSDKAIKGIETEISKQEGPFVQLFIDRYKDRFHLRYEAPSKPLRSPFEAPSEDLARDIQDPTKPLRSTETETEAETETEKETDTDAEKPKPVDDLYDRIFNHYQTTILPTYKSSYDLTIRNIKSLVKRLRAEGEHAGKTKQQVSDFLIECIDRYKTSTKYMDTIPKFRYKQSNFWGQLNSYWQEFTTEEKDTEKEERNMELKENQIACIKRYEEANLFCWDERKAEHTAPQCSGCPRRSQRKPIDIVSPADPAEAFDPETTPFEATDSDWDAVEAQVEDERQEDLKW